MYTHPVVHVGERCFAARLPPCQGFRANSPPLLSPRLSVQLPLLPLLLDNDSTRWKHDPVAQWACGVPWSPCAPLPSFHYQPSQHPAGITSRATLQDETLSSSLQRNRSHCVVSGKHLDSSSSPRCSAESMALTPSGITPARSWYQYPQKESTRRDDGTPQLSGPSHTIPVEVLQSMRERCAIWRAVSNGTGELRFALLPTSSTARSIDVDDSGVREKIGSGQCIRPLATHDDAGVAVLTTAADDSQDRRRNDAMLC